MTELFILLGFNFTGLNYKLGGTEKTLILLCGVFSIAVLSPLVLWDINIYLRMILIISAVLPLVLTAGKSRLKSFKLWHNNVYCFRVCLGRLLLALSLTIQIGILPAGDLPDTTALSFIPYAALCLSTFYLGVLTYRMISALNNTVSDAGY